jgi:hypothetical protein
MEVGLSESGSFSHRPDAREYAFEGRVEDPYAWVDWIIKARSFALEIHWLSAIFQCLDTPDPGARL